MNYCIKYFLKRVVIASSMAITCSGCILATTHELDSLLIVLDREINNPEYRIEREKRIEDLRCQLACTNGSAKRYALNEQIIELYTNYQSDSLLSYLDRNIVLARNMGDVDEFNRNTIRKSYVLGELAIPHEALDALCTVDPRTLGRTTLIPYYEASTNLYRITRSETRNSKIYHSMDSLYVAYRDSLLANVDPESNVAYQNRIDSLAANGDAINALRMAQVLASRVTPSDPMYGFTQYKLAVLLNANDMADERDAAFARSALSDIRNCTYENAALANLAVNLADRKDYKRAYNYIHRSLDDANSFNSSYRRNLLLPSIASIEALYNNDLNERHDRLLIIFIMTIVATIIICSLLIVLYKTVKRKHMLNTLLREAYEKERENNNNLIEANTIKEECIHSFLTNAVDNLNTLEQYRMMVYNKLVNKQYSELADLVKANSFAHREVDEFYNDFDRVILRIFPSFVESFNSLLRPECQILSKRKDSLTPELRIFALIRLGIDNPADIAKLLRYSMSTIYNYRVKVRKCALEGIKPEDFEAKVMLIGAI